MNKIWMVGATLAWAASMRGQPVVTSVVIDAIGHSTARVTATSSVAPVGGQRIRYGLTTSYEGGSGGGLNNQGYSFCNHDPNFCPGIFQIYDTLSGLLPNTLYHVQMQASTDGVNWGSSADASFTTLPLPTPSPAYPNPPETFDTSYPDTSGYTTVTAANCSDLNTKLATAVNNRGSGWVITLAPGLFDTTSETCMQPPIDPGAMPFAPANVNTSTNQITVTGALTAGEQIRFAPYGGACLPSTNPSAGGFCQLRGNLIQGVLYYVLNPTSGGGTTSFQVAATVGGSAIALSDSGSGTSYVVPLPAAGGPQIIIRTSTPDNAFCPPGVRCMGSVWVSAMATINVTGGLWTSVNGSAGPLIFQTNVGAHDIRFVGIEMTNTDASSLATTSTDPRPTLAYFYSNVADAPTRIIIDRSYIHGLGYPNRIYRPIYGFDGKYMAIINSDLEKWDFWRPWLDSGTPGTRGFAQTISGSQVSTGAGTYHMGTATCTASGLSVTFTGGTASGTAKAYFSMNCTPTYVIPAGLTATCAGTGSDGTNTRFCVVMTAATPDYLRDVNGGYGSGPIAGITLASGTPTGAGNEYGYGASIYLTEGTQGLIAGWGPGPYQMYNNYLEGAGLLWHWDDSAGGLSVGSGYVLQRNTFFVDPKYITGGPQSDGLDYKQRNGPEWKTGTNALIDGNTWTNYFAAVSSEGCAIELTARAAGIDSDFEIRNNTFTNGACMVQAIGGLATGGQQQPKPFQRLWVHNNLDISANGWTQFSAADRTYAIPYPFSVGYAMEDIIVEHNTIFDNRGPDPSFIHLIGSPEGNVEIRNNIFWINNDHGSYGLDTEGFGGNTPQCNGNAKAAMDCAFVQGIGNTQYTFAQNALVGYYANSQNLTGSVDPTVLASQYAGLPVLVAPGSTPQSNLQYVGFSNPSAKNFRLMKNPASPYLLQATDVTDIGVNQEALDAAQGVVYNPRKLSITQSSASIYFSQADGVGCPVDFSTNPGFAGFVRLQSTNTGEPYGWHSDLASLSSNTRYYYRILCAVQQPTGNFVTMP
jgi:hypothetical protein